MGLLKFFGSVAMGIGAIALAPAAIAVSATTLACGGVAGAIGYGISASRSKRKMEEARNEGERIATARNCRKMKRVNESVKKVKEVLAADKEYFQFIIALVAVGLASANADGNVSEIEQTELEEFVAGISHKKLPPHVRGIITRLKNKPPSFNTAMQYVKRLGEVELKVFGEIIEVVANADGKVTKKEAAMLAAFQKAVA